MYIYSQWNVDRWPDDRCAGSMRERMFKIIYSSPYASHESATSSRVFKYWYIITCPSIWKHNFYINVHLQSMKRRGTTFNWIQCQNGVVLAGLSIEHTAWCSVHWPRIWHGNIQTICGYAPARSIANWGWLIVKQALSKTCIQIHVSRWRRWYATRV